jgi:putative ABC transport system permease protein
MFRLIKNSYQSLINQRPYSIINIIGLSIGLTCVILILLWIKSETGYDRFHNDYERIYRVNNIMRTPNREMNMGGINAPGGPEFKANFPSIEDYVRYRLTYSDIKYEDQFYRIDLVYADNNFFRMLNFPLESGDRERCLSSPDKVVLSRSTATRIFGSDDPVNKIIEISNESFVVSGVAKDPPLNSSISFDGVVQLSVLEQQSHVGWDGGLQCQTFVKLVPGTDPNALLGDMKEYLYKMINERFLKSGFEIVPYLQPIKDMHLHSDTEFDTISKGSVKRIISFAFVGLLILMTACFNFVNISTALSMKRSKEVSIRKIYGSGRKRLVVLFVSETGLSILFAIIISLLLSKTLLHFFNGLIGSELDFSILAAHEWILLAMILWIVCVFMASFYSAWYLSAIPPMSILRPVSGGKGRQISRNILVTFQFALSISLIISCLVMYSQMQYIDKIDKGFSDENVVYLGLSMNASQRSEIIKERLQSVPGIVSVTRSAGGMPGMSFTSNGYHVEGIDKPIMSNAVYVDKDYIATMGIQLESGRDFMNNTGDVYNVLVNEAFVKTAGWEEPLGKTIERNHKYTVIGIVGDFLTGSLHNGIQPVFITLDNERSGFGVIILKLGSKLNNTIRSQIEQIYLEEDPDNPFALEVMNEVLRDQYDRERNLNTIFFVLSLLAILISSLGLFGLATYSSQVRRKEIGVRKVNGALISDIIRRFTGDLLIWIVIAFLIAAPVTVFIMKDWLTNFEYKTGISPLVIIAGGLAAMLIGLVSISLATLREAGRNPSETLRV